MKRLIDLGAEPDAANTAGATRVDVGRSGHRQDAAAPRCRRERRCAFGRSADRAGDSRRNGRRDSGGDAAARVRRQSDTDDCQRSIAPPRGGAGQQPRGISRVARVRRGRERIAHRRFSAPTVSRARRRSASAARDHSARVPPVDTGPEAVAFFIGLADRRRSTSRPRRRPRFTPPLNAGCRFCRRSTSRSFRKPDACPVTTTAWLAWRSRSRGATATASTRRRRTGNGRSSRRYVESWRERTLQNMFIAGQQDTISYLLFGMAVAGHPSDGATDAQVQWLLRRQSTDGHWPLGTLRPPIESNDIEVTAMSMRALAGVLRPRPLRPATGRRSRGRATGWSPRRRRAQKSARFASWASRGPRRAGRS